METINIPCCIDKNGADGNFCKSEDAKLCDVGTDVCRTVTCKEPGLSVHHSNMCIVAMRGRNPEHPTDRTPGLHTEQRLEPNLDGICNTLTTVQKDNLVMEKVKIKQATKEGYAEMKIGGVCDLSFPESEIRRGRVQEGGDVCPTLTAQNNEICRIEKVGQISNDGSQRGTVVSDRGVFPTLSAGTHGYANPHLYTQYRIRKLTPKECWRLMGFTDEDFEKAASVNSNTQLYKQAGNSIVVNCLEGIFSNLIGKTDGE